MRTVAIESKGKVTVVTKDSVFGFIDIFGGIKQYAHTSPLSIMKSTAAPDMVEGQEFSRVLATTLTTAAIEFNELTSKFLVSTSLAKISFGLVFLPISPIIFFLALFVLLIPLLLFLKDPISMSHIVDSLFDEQLFSIGLVIGFMIAALPFFATWFAAHLRTRIKASNWFITNCALFHNTYFITNEFQSQVGIK